MSATARKTARCRRIFWSKRGSLVSLTAYTTADGTGDEMHLRLLGWWAIQGRGAARAAVDRRGLRWR